MLPFRDLVFSCTGFGLAKHIVHVGGLGLDQSDGPARASASTRHGVTPSSRRAVSSLSSLANCCSFLGIAGREMNEKWDDKGAGAVFFLQQEMTDSVTGAQACFASNCASAIWQEGRRTVLLHSGSTHGHPSRSVAGVQWVGGEQAASTSDASAFYWWPLPRPSPRQTTLGADEHAWLAYPLRLMQTCCGGCRLPTQSCSARCGSTAGVLAGQAGEQPAVCSSQLSSAASCLLLFPLGKTEARQAHCATHTFSHPHPHHLPRTVSRLAGWLSSARRRACASCTTTCRYTTSGCRQAGCCLKGWTCGVQVYTTSRLVVKSGSLLFYTLQDVVHEAQTSKNG